MAADIPDTTQLANDHPPSNWQRFVSSSIGPITTTAMLGIVATLVSSNLQSYSALRLEEKKLQSSLIDKAIDKDNPRKSARSLLFLLDLGLIEDRNGKIESFRNDPGSAPTKASIVPQDSASTEVFYSCYLSGFGRFNPRVTANLSAIFDFVARDATLQDVRQLAYVLATIKYETGDTYQPLAEYGDNSYFEAHYGPETPSGKALGNSSLADSSKYKGRGYAQTTGRNNYQALSAKLGVDLIEKPDLLLSPDLAYRALLFAMNDGLFTGKKLSDFITVDSSDYVQARKIMNGQDHAELIAGSAKVFETCLIESAHAAAGSKKTN